jgi:hypothetical protein
VFGPLICFGLLLLLPNIRPVEFAQFRSDAGVAVLDVKRIGPQSPEFDDFVGLLVKRIQAVRGRAEPLPTNSPGDGGADRA